jgi:hypothetical protein
MNVAYGVQVPVVQVSEVPDEAEPANELVSQVASNVTGCPPAHVKVVVVPSEVPVPIAAPEAFLSVNVALPVVAFSDAWME